MFGRGRQKATATVQYCEEFVPKHGENRLVAGGWMHDLVVDVQPETGPAFRASTKHPFHMFAKPNVGDVVLVTFDPRAKDHDVRVLTEGDPRYDLEAREQQQNLDNTARRDAILAGADPASFASPMPSGAVGFDAELAELVALEQAGMSTGAPPGADDPQLAASLAVLGGIVEAEQAKIASLQPKARLGMGFTPHAVMQNGAVVARGLVIDQIDPAGPGAQAGLVDGDVLMTFSGQTVRMPSDVMAMLNADVVGRPVPITIWRGGREVALTVVPAPR